MWARQPWVWGQVGLDQLDNGRTGQAMRGMLTLRDRGVLLPEEVALEVAAARVSDPDGVRRVLGEPIDTLRDAS